MSEEQKPSFLDKFSLPFGTLWDKYKVFLIIFGIFILIWKFRSLIIDLLVSDVHTTMDKAQKQDATLRQEEKEANDQANKLRQEADALSKDKPEVDEDWHKK